MARLRFPEESKVQVFRAAMAMHRYMHSTKPPRDAVAKYLNALLRACQRAESARLRPLMREQMAAIGRRSKRERSKE